MRRNVAPATHASGRWLLPGLALMLWAIVACQPSVPGEASNGGLPGQSGTPRHIFVINLENQNYDTVWGAGSAAPYLSVTLRRRGVLLQNYYGIAHDSLPNYIAQISGQPPNGSTRRDCHTYSPFQRTGADAQGRLEGDGCVFPADVPTLASQLTASGKTWKGYMEDMPSPCLHPDLYANDTHVKATTEGQYATKHNPFVYFRSITTSPECTNNVVNFERLSRDLASAETTPNLAYITPNLCHDGHDHPCVDGTEGGLPAADQWLREQVPAILASPAYQQDGMLVITFDEAERGVAGPAEGTPGSVPGGTAGGRIGALVLSPFSTPGGTSVHPYNHYSLLATLEDFFSLPRLGTAKDPGIAAFGADVYEHD